MYYGWVILFVCAVATAASAPGQTIVVSLFHAPLRQAAGLSATELATAYLAATLGSAAAMPFVGTLSDRIGPKWIVVGSAIGVALATIAIGHVGGAIALTVALFGLRFFGQGALALGSSHLVALWFERRLGLAHGLRGVSVSLAFAAIGPAVHVAIATLGWARAYAALGIALGGAVVVLTLALVRPAPADLNATIEAARAPGAAEGSPEPQGGPLTSDDPDLRAAIRTAAYWAVAGSLVAPALTVTAVLFHLTPVLTAARLDGAVPATALTAFSLGVGAGTLGGGWLVDRVEARFVLLAAGAGNAAATAFLALVATPAAALAALAAIGVAHGTSMNAGATALARWFGRTHHGAIRGFTTSAAVAGDGRRARDPVGHPRSDGRMGGWARGARDRVARTCHRRRRRAQAHVNNRLRERPVSGEGRRLSWRSCGGSGGSGGIVAVGAVLLGPGGGAWALTGGRLLVIVQDSEELPIAGAAIALSSDVLVGGTQHKEADPHGEAMFSELPPGRYDLEVKAPGVQGGTRRGDPRLPPTAPPASAFGWTRPRSRP